MSEKWIHDQKLELISIASWVTHKKQVKGEGSKIFDSGLSQWETCPLEPWVRGALLQVKSMRMGLYLLEAVGMHPSLVSIALLCF